jgi:hypothetical protein
VALQAPRCANAHQVSHQKAQIERADVDQEPLEDVVVTAQVYAPHAAGFVHMRARALQPFPTQAQQAFAALTVNATAVPILTFALRPGLAVVPIAPHELMRGSHVHHGLLGLIDSRRR